MSLSKERLKKVDGYLAEIKAKCISCKNNLSQEEYDKFLSYFKEVSVLLKDKTNHNHTDLTAKCDEIILIFTKYFIGKRDQSRNERLKSASIIKEGMLAYKGNDKNLREVQHVLSLLKEVYFHRFENAIEPLNKFDDNKNTLETLRVKFFHAKTPAECATVLWHLNKRYQRIISKEIPELNGIVASYSNILDKQCRINLLDTNSAPSTLPKAAFFAGKLEQVAKQPTSHVKSLIGKFGN